MIHCLTLILAAQLAGEAAARALGLPVPGPVIGMALMLGFLVLRDRGPATLPRLLPAPLTDGTLEATGRGLLAHLSLMFVPAGAGIVGRLDVVRLQGAKLGIVLLVSTTVALLVTVLVFRGVSRLMGPNPIGPGEPGGDAREAAAASLAAAAPSASASSSAAPPERTAVEPGRAA